VFFSGVVPAEPYHCPADEDGKRTGLGALTRAEVEPEADLERKVLPSSRRCLLSLPYEEGS
jgi:hypothetical protein